MNVKAGLLLATVLLLAGKVAWGDERCTVTQLGRCGDVLVSPDGRYVLIASRHRVLLTDWRQGERTALGDYHAGYIVAMAFSVDAELAALAESDGRVTIWRRSGACKATLPGTASITAMAFSPNARSIACLEETGVLRVWDWLNGRCVMTRPIGQEFTTLLYSSNGKLLAAGGNKGVKVWRSGDGTECAARSTPGKVTALGFDANGRILAMAGDFPCVYLRNLETGNDDQAYYHGGHATALVYNDAVLAVGLDDGTVKVWDYHNNRPKWTHKVEGGFIGSLRNADGGITAISFHDVEAAVMVWK